MVEFYINRPNTAKRYNTNKNNNKQKPLPCFFYLQQVGLGSGLPEHGAGADGSRAAAEGLM